MKIRIVAVGKIKENYLLEAQTEYVKRLGRFCTVEIVEVADEKDPDRSSPAATSVVLKKEGERVIRAAAGFGNVALAIEGRQYTSEQFALEIERISTKGCSPDICFVIGGSLGLAEEIKKNATISFSLSALTLPHRLARIVLLEQLFRAFKILSGETYHK